MTKNWHQYSKVAPKAERTGQDGFVYDSKTEYQRYCYLNLLEKAGEIVNLQRQVKYTLEYQCPCGQHPPINVIKMFRGGVEGTAHYTPDFVYDIPQADGSFVRVIEDVKGYRDEDSKFRIRVFEALYGLKVTLIKKQGRNGWAVLK